MNKPESIPANESITDTAPLTGLFCDYPAEYFGNSYTKVHSIPRDELQATQLEALQKRFEFLRENVPMLRKLADRQGIDEIEELEDVIPLLFEHTMYKSYPPKLLADYRFADINRWMGRLSVYDFTSIDVSDCEFIDDWARVMDERSPISLCTSSGTTGTMSFMPHSKEELDLQAKNYGMNYMQNFGDDPDEALSDELYIVFPYFRGGYGGRPFDLNLQVKHLLNGDESRLYSAYPGAMSYDALYLAGRLRAAQASGELDKLEINPSLLKRREEFEALDREMPEQLEKFMDECMDTLKGKRILMQGMAWQQGFDMAAKGMARGLEKLFKSNSVIITGGGKKAGAMQPEDFEEVMCRFTGVSRMKGVYAMTEGLARHMRCEYGQYHLSPWIIPYVLDPDTSKPLPRTGKVTGRMAFYDLLARSHWGGFISGDEVTINWTEPCACGQTSVHLDDTIGRFADKRGGDDKISCAATPGAHKEAMDFLNNLSQ